MTVRAFDFDSAAKRVRVELENTGAVVRPGAQQRSQCRREEADSRRGVPAVSA